MVGLPMNACTRVVFSFKYCQPKKLFLGPSLIITLGDKSRLLTLRSQFRYMRRIELNTYSKLHFIQKYVLCFTDRVCFVILHQLVQRRKLSDPQVVLFLLIFEDLKVLHLVATPIKVIRVVNKSCRCFNLLFFRGRNPASRSPSIFLDKTHGRASTHRVRAGWMVM